MQNFFQRGSGGQSQPILTYALIAVNVVMLLAMEVAGGSTDTGVLVDFGAMYGPKIAEGDYWRLFTAMFLHVGFVHLAFNAFGLFIFGRMVEGVFGPFRFALLYVLSGLFGSVTSYLIGPDAIAAGASGALFGIIGVMAAYFAVQRKVLGKSAQQNLHGLLGLAGINVVFGLLSPGIDNWAHLGGFAAGFGLGYAMTPDYDVVRSLTGRPMGMRERTGDRAKSLWVVGLVIVVLVLGVWAGSVSLSDSTAVHVRDAEQFMDMGDYAAALTEIDRAFDVATGPTPELGRAYFLRGFLKGNSGDIKGAITDLAQAARLGDVQTRRSASALLVQINSGS